LAGPAWAQLTVLDTTFDAAVYSTYGENGFVSDAGSENAGSIEDATFTVDGTEYTITRVLDGRNTDYRVTVRTSPFIPEATFNTLTLTIKGQEFSGTDFRSVGTQYETKNALPGNGLDFGTSTITLKIQAPGGPPNVGDHQLRFEEYDRLIWVFWNRVDEADSYGLRWRASTETDWDNATELVGLTQTNAKAKVDASGTEYGFQLRAYKDGLAGEWGTEQSSTTIGVSPPLKMSPPSLTMNDGSITVSWDHPGSTVDTYEVRWMITGQGFTKPIVKNILNREQTFSGLQNGTRYSFQVRSKNSAGTGYWSRSSHGRPREAGTVVQADRPCDVRVTPGNAKTRLLWRDPADDGGSAMLRYEIQMAKAGQDWTNAPRQIALKSNPPTLNDEVVLSGERNLYVWTGLQNSSRFGKNRHRYQFRIRVVTSHGPGRWSKVLKSEPSHRYPW